MSFEVDAKKTMATNANLMCEKTLLYIENSTYRLDSITLTMTARLSGRGGTDV
jgi:hypothetical protein